MTNHIRYYLFLAVADLMRLWRTTQNHVIIVAGICLPLFLLLGIKTGFIDEMSKELRESPTGRQITFWPIQDDVVVTETNLADFKNEIPGIDLVIPDIQRLVSIKSLKSENIQPLEVTLYPTTADDPVQKALGLKTITGNGQIILSKTVKDHLQVNPGDEVQITVTRKDGTVSESHQINEMKVIDFYDSGDSNSNVGYTSIEFIDGIEGYIQGFAYEDFELPALARPYKPDYEGYVLFSRGILPNVDLTTIKQLGFDVQPIQELQESDSLLLLKKFVEQLWQDGDQSQWTAYLLAVSSNKSGKVTYAPNKIKDSLTSADIHISPWVPPVLVESEHGVNCLISLDLQRNAFARKSFTTPGLSFRGTETNLSVFRISGVVEQSSVYELDLADIGVLFLAPVEHDNISERVYEEKQIPLASDNTKTVFIEELGDNIEEIEFFVVQHDLLGGIRDARKGLCALDKVLNTFTAVRPDIRYNRLRLYCDTIDEVPIVAASLVESGFAILSEKDRIDEIQGTNKSLGLLVLVVGCGVLGFGIFTVISVLTDSTDRKRGTIGILRVMGVSKSGVFFIVVVRAALIGIIAGALSIIIGYLIAASIANHVTVSFLPIHIGIVLGGAFICAGGGSLFPAYKASNLDPFEAILEGKAG